MISQEFESNPYIQYLRCGLEESHTYIKLPSFNVFSSLLACNNYHKLRDLSTNHPFV